VVDGFEMDLIIFRDLRGFFQFGRNLGIFSGRGGLPFWPGRGGNFWGGLTITFFLFPKKIRDSFFLRVDFNGVYNMGLKNRVFTGGFHITFEIIKPGGEKGFLFFPGFYNGRKMGSEIISGGGV